jgi:transcriptional regulator with XRE-family HTH domain
MGLKFLPCIFEFEEEDMCIAWMDLYNIRRDMVALPMCQIQLKAQKPLNSAYPVSLITVGDHIRKKRLDLSLTQKAVAKLCGVDECTVTNWEKNHSQPRLYLLPKIIEYLGYLPFELANETIGNKIIAYRMEHGLSQRILAELLSVDETTIRDWENGKHKPSKKLLERISKILV